MMLYHYTNLNNLALLLKEKKIRLSSLNGLDDLSEGRTRDMGKDFGGKYVFVSCWTDIEEESLPFWNMYTPKMAGVRIGLPAPYLKTYTDEALNESGVTYQERTNYLPLKKRFGDDYLVIHNGLIKIEYTDDENKLNPKVHTEGEENGHSIAFGEKGKYKKTYWSFQSEWRFRIITIPSIPSTNEDYKKKEFYIAMKDVALKKLLKGEELSIKEFYLDIDKDAFSKMELLLGPKCKDGDLEIVRALKEAYNPTATIEISKLSGDIR